MYVPGETLVRLRRHAVGVPSRLPPARDKVPVAVAKDRLYRSFLDTLPEAVVISDGQGTIVAANRRCEELLGYTSEELVGNAVELLVPPRFASHASLRRGYYRAPETRPMAKGANLYVQAKSGEEIAVNIALSPTTLEDGRTGVVVSLHDVRARMRTEEQLRIQTVALEAAASGIIITDRNGSIRWANPAASAMSGYALDELIGSNPRLLKSGQHSESFYRDLWSTVVAGKTWRGAIINRRKDGSLYHEEQTIAPVTTDGGEITHFIAIKQDVTRRVEAEQALSVAHEELTRRLGEIEVLSEQLRAQAIRDSLTGLFNRRYLDEMLPRELARASRGDLRLCAVMLDVDNFKRVNDSFGHEVGDRYLRELAEVLTSNSRTSDMVCRFGGEEFVVILPGAPLTIAERRADDWRARFSEAVVEGGAQRCTLSGGVAEWRGPDEEPHSLLRRADEAMYDAKHAGRDRIVCAGLPRASGGGPRKAP